MSVPLTFHWSKQVPQLHLILNYPHLSILLNAWKYNPLKEKQQIIGKNNITYMGVSICLLICLIEDSIPTNGQIIFSSSVNSVTSISIWFNGSY